MKDKQTGISLRFIRQYDPAIDRHPDTSSERIWALAMADEREDVPFMQKLFDAREFIRLHTH